MPLRREVSPAPLVTQVMSEIEVASADRDVDVRSDCPTISRRSRPTPSECTR